MTPARDMLVVLDEIIDHIDYVLAKAQHQSISEFRANRDIRQSVERSLEIISETSRHLSTELKNSKPDIPWRQVADFGNVLRHSYFAINAEIVLKIVQENLRPLRIALTELRNSMGR
jgi:uncharacterized protein with HEPN domain